MARSEIENGLHDGRIRIQTRYTVISSDGTYDKDEIEHKEDVLDTTHASLHHVWTRVDGDDAAIADQVINAKMVRRSRMVKDRQLLAP